MSELKEYEVGEFLTVNGEHFIADGNIGSGGMAVVDRVIDEDDNFKTLKRYKDDLCPDTSDAIRDGTNLRLQLGKVDAIEFTMPKVVETIYGGYIETVVADYFHGNSFDAHFDGVLDKLEKVKLLKRFVLSLARFFEFMIDAGFVHRDIKAGNVIVNSETDELAILDYDFMCRSNTDIGPLVFGTPGSMPPEYGRGSISDTVDVFATAAEVAYRIDRVAKIVGLSSSRVRRLDYYRRKGGVFNYKTRGHAYMLLRDPMLYDERIRKEIAGLIEFVIAGLKVDPLDRPRTYEEVRQLLEHKPNIEQL